MCLTLRRWASTSISSATKGIAERLLQETQKAAPLVRKQLIDGNQLQRLGLTLNRPNLYLDISVKDQFQGLSLGTPVPPGYHLVYFTPAFLPNELGQDGADISYNPPPPFTRRMWAGGKLVWQKDNPLRVGEDATETTKLVSSEAKRTRNGEEMIVVGVEKSFENSRGLALVDRRDWVFRLRLDPRTQSQQNPELGGDASLLPKAENPLTKTRDFLQTPLSLFRFSALTFNAHMIHYSQPWCREVEGHPGLVVHGPLNMINMLDFWRDEKGEDGYAIPESMRYRATAPFYMGETYRAFLERGDGETFVRLWGSDGKGNARMGMMGDITG